MQREVSSPPTAPGRRSGRVTRFHIAVLVVAWLIAAGVGYRSYQSLVAPVEAAVQGIPAAVQRGTLTATITASGSVVSTKQARLTFGVSGKITETMVGLGDTVKAGQPMAKVDATQLEIKLAQAQSSLRQAQLKLQQLKTGATAEEIAAAKAAYDSAVARYNEVAKGPAESDIKAAEQAVASAEANLIQAQNNLATLKAKPDPNDIRDAELALEQAKLSLYATQIDRDATCGRGKGYQCDAANAQVMAREAAVTQAQLKLERAKQPAKPEEIANAEKAVQSAQAALDAARARLAQSKAGPTAADLAAAKSAVDSAKAQLELKTRGATAEDIALAEEVVKQAEIAVKTAELDLQSAIIVAPFDGVVASIGGNVGEQIASGTAMFTLVDPKSVRVDVNVAETDIPKVTVGKSAVVTFDALSGQRFQGKVIAISPSATVQQGVATYLVSLAVQANDVTLPAGLTTTASIVVEEKDGVLMVPNRAIRVEGRNRVVDVLVGDKTETRQVRVGMSNDQFTEVTSGLSEGDQVVIKSTTTAAPRVPAMGGMGPVGIPGGFAR